MFQGAKVPGSESSRVRKFQGAKVPVVELSLPGANGLGSEKSIILKTGPARGRKNYPRYITAVDIDLFFLYSTGTMIIDDRTLAPFNLG